MLGRIGRRQTTGSRPWQCCGWMSEKERILVGTIGAAQGVKGEVRLKSYTGTPSAIADYGPLSSEDGGRSFEIIALRSLKDDMLAVRLSGISDRNSAAALTNTRLYVDRAKLPPPDADEFYQVDLIGLAAEAEDGRPLGRVIAVENYGAGDLLEIAPQAGETILVPFTKAFVPTLDFEGKRAVIAAGALESPAKPGEGSS